MPTKEVVDEYVTLVGVENVAGTGIHFLDCALSVNEIKGLPAIPEHVCSVRERPQKVQHDDGDQGSFEQFRSGPMPLVEPWSNEDNRAT